VSADQNGADRTALSPVWTRLADGPEEGQWTNGEHAQFMKEFDEMVTALESNPSVVVWVPFNEAWGQHRTAEVGKWISARDPSRLVNVASGGNFVATGDIVDNHNYPPPSFPAGHLSDYRDFVKVGREGKGRRQGDEGTRSGRRGCKKMAFSHATAH
jgi:beta-galactosidase